MLDCRRPGTTHPQKRAESAAISHRIQRRLEAHILIAFLDHSLWIRLKQKLRAAGSLSPAQVIHSLKQIILVEVGLETHREQTLLVSERGREPELRCNRSKIFFYEPLKESFEETVVALQSASEDTLW